MKSTASLSQTPEQRSKSDSLLSISYRLYNDCGKLPLDRFIDCLVDNDLSQLIITGTATESELQTVWDKIYVQYCQLSQDGSYNEVFEILKEIDDLKAKITIANNSIKHLQLSFDQDLVNVLNSLALRCTVKDGDKGEVLINKLNAVVARIKKWFPRLSKAEKDLNVLRETNTGKIDRAYFDDVLEAMSEHKGYQIEASKITVSRFCRSLVKMNEQAQKENLKNLKNAS